MLNVRLMVITTNQKPTVDTQMIKELSIPLKKVIKSQRKRARREQRNYKTTTTNTT